MLDQIIKTSLAEQLQLDIDVKKTTAADETDTTQPDSDSKGLSRGTWIIVFLLLGLVGGSGVLFRLSKFLYKKGVSLAYILRGGKIRDVIKQWKNKGGVKSAEDAIEEMYRSKQISDKQRKELLDALENPAISRELEREFFDLAKTSFERGELTADEFLATLEPQARKKYEPLIKKIEKERNVAKVGTTSSSESKIFKRITTVTEKQFDNVINQNESLLKKIYSINDFVAFKNNKTGILANDLNYLKRELTNPTKGLAKFKDKINTLQEYIQKCKEHNIKLPNNPADLEKRWRQYQLKQLF